MKETLGGTGGSQRADALPARIGVWQLPERFVHRAQGITLIRVSFHGTTPRAPLARGFCRQRAALASARKSGRMWKVTNDRGEDESPSGRLRLQRASTRATCRAVRAPAAQRDHEIAIQ